MSHHNHNHNELLYTTDDLIEELYNRYHDELDQLQSVIEKYQRSIDERSSHDDHWVTGIVANIRIVHANAACD